MIGSALLVGVQQFGILNLDAIPGALADLKQLEPTWTSLGLSVDTLKNTDETKVTKKVLWGKIDEVIQQVKTNNGRCLVICITTHGSERKDENTSAGQHLLCLYNERITTQSILHKLAADEDLKDALKLIMISACRSGGRKKSGKNVGVEIQLVDDPKDEYSNITTVLPPPPGPEPEPEESSCFVPELPENCALWFASPSGYSAYATPSGATYFFQEFSKQVEKGNSVDIVDLVIGVHAAISDRIFKRKFKLIPSFIHNLTSSFKFTKTS